MIQKPEEDDPAPEEDYWEEGAAAPSSPLEKNDPSPDITDEEHTREMRGLEKESLKARIRHRAKLLRWIVCASTGMLVASGIFLGWYLCLAKEDADSAVLIAWFGSTAIELLGLVAIAARYLFTDSERFGI